MPLDNNISKSIYFYPDTCVAYSTLTFFSFLLVPPNRLLLSLIVFIF